jgi:hypothetical protein
VADHVAARPPHRSGSGIAVIFVFYAIPLRSITPWEK